MSSISKKITWSMGHALSYPYPDTGPCARLHGHNYEAFITMQGPLNGTGMVLDASNFSPVKEWVMNNLDHRMLLRFDHILFTRIYTTDIDKIGAVSVPFNPTAENLAAVILGVTNKVLPIDNREDYCMSVTIQETNKIVAIVNDSDDINWTEQYGQVIGMDIKIARRKLLNAAGKMSAMMSRLLIDNMKDCGLYDER